MAAKCRAVHWLLKQKIRRKYEKQNTTKIQQQILYTNAHLPFAFTSAWAEISSWQTAV
jgi:hypothetical protein